MVNHFQFGITRSQLIQHLAGIVPAAIVGDDHFIIVSHLAQSQQSDQDHAGDSPCVVISWKNRTYARNLFELVIRWHQLSLGIDGLFLKVNFEFNR